MMANSYTAAILVARAPQEVFDVVNDVRAWWSGDIVGTTDRLGGEFSYRYKTLHRSRQTITELVPGKKIVWQVSDSYLDFVNDKAEWDGTKMVFDITRKGDKTELRFTHVGLVPALPCYGDCCAAWRFYITESLRKLLETGQGQPNPKEPHHE